jgi:hypothetical protein
MSAPGITTDAHGNRYAAVPVEELDDWAWMLSRLEDWLGHAGHDTIEDWADFAGPGGIRLDHVVYVLSHWAPRMRALAQLSTPTPRRRR